MQRFLSKWSLLYEAPLFASGPVPTGEPGLDADLNCIVVAEENNLDLRELETLFRDASRNEGRGLVERVFHGGIWRWQTELYMGGCAEPKFNIDDRAHTLQTFDNKVAFIFDREPVAHWKFWYEEWFPARLSGVAR